MVDVSVVVPYYEQPRLLTIVVRGLLAACDAASDAGISTEIIVADDGSRAAPDLTAYPQVMYVRQSDLGFRAAAARNLGATNASGRLLLFLDGDCRPEPDYIVAMAQALEESHVVVARRRHTADLATWPTVQELPEPQWLLRGYDESDQLRNGGSRDYRFVISAVMGVRAADFWRWGGFDESLVGYGGEDWDLAFRAYNAGASFRYEPRAVAWHHGPDAAAREISARTKNEESLALARRITDRAMRPRGLVWAYPAVVVVVATDVSKGALAWLAERWLVGDCAIYLLDCAQPCTCDPHGNGGLGADLRAAAPAAWFEDPRIRQGHPPRDVLLRAGVIAQLSQVVAPAWGQFDSCVAAEADYDGFTVQTTRNRCLGATVPPRTVDESLWERLDAEPHLEAEWDWLR